MRYPLRGVGGTLLLLMKTCTILVLADPAEPQLAMLRGLPPDTAVVVGNSAEAFAPTVRDASVILNWSGSLDLFREVFRRTPNLRWIHSRSAGLDRTLFPELIESPVTLTNGTGVFSPSLGEFALAAILYFAKDFRRMVRNQMACVWEPFDVLPVSGRTVGIVGYGDIGRAVAARAAALGMKVLALKRHATITNPDPLVEQVYGPDGRFEMLSRCDYVVVAAPLTSETRAMIAEPEFAVMKSEAVVINVGRGPVIKEEALLGALSAGRIKGAALDVFDREPLPSNHPFYNLENVLLSPHCADHTPDWLDQAMQFFLAQFQRFQNNEPLLNVVDKQLGY
jgi:phosphoglycerate dehydrogenase-like enzyme